jgi:hypothetical protein
VGKEKRFKIPIVFAKKSFDRRMKGKYIWNVADHGFFTNELGDEPNLFAIANFTR